MLDTSTLSEPSIFIDPDNPQVILVAMNAGNWAREPRVVEEESDSYSQRKFYGAAAWVSTDGGQTWMGNTSGVGGPDNQGDPAAVVGRPIVGTNPRMYVGYIAYPSTHGQEVAYSDDLGASWVNVTVAQCPGCIQSNGDKLDKNHLWIDNSLASPYNGHLYAAWTHLEGYPPHHVEFARSTGHGELGSWSSPTVISASLSDERHDGVNIKTGPNGEVYLVWAVYAHEIDGVIPDETGLGFARSLDGGATWSPATYIRNNIKGHRNTPLTGPPYTKRMRHNSFPSMTVNQQTGRIYVVWTNQGVPGPNDGDPDIWMVTSTNRGDSWTSPVKVDQDTHDKDQWFPWISCDPVSGALACTYYDSRDFALNDSVRTYVSTSYDNGAHWSDLLVTDHPKWAGNKMPGAVDNYAGDYIGIAVRSNVAYPIWCDDRAQPLGNMLIYLSPFTVCPIAMTGDVNLSSSITSGDVIYLNNYMWYGGPAPLPCPASGDVNCSGSVTMFDVLYLNNYIFYSGPAPCDVCGLFYNGTWACN